MNWPAVLSWVITAIGVYLIWTGIRAVLYFQHHGQVMGRNWVLIAFEWTCITVTAVTSILFSVRIVVLFLSPPLTVDDPYRVWGGVISGLAILWEQLIPDLLRRWFQEHEGI